MINAKFTPFIIRFMEKHHLKVIGGFQFSSHKSDDEWREFGINHFVIPQVLISNISNWALSTVYVR
jgi:menaquinone-specific isochorismate synthase